MSSGASPPVAGGTDVVGIGVDVVGIGVDVVGIGVVELVLSSPGWQAVSGSRTSIRAIVQE